MEKDLHTDTDTHKVSPEEILRQKILSARINKPAPAEEEKDESYSELPANKTWFEKNEYVVIGAIVVIVVIAGCIVLNVLGG